MVTVNKRPAADSKVSRATAAMFFCTARRLTGDADLLRAAIAFANGGTRFKSWRPDKRDIAWLEEWRRCGGNEAQRAMIPSISSLAPQRQAELQGLMAAYLEAPQSLRKRFAKEFGDQLEDVTLKPRWQLSHHSVMRTDEIRLISWPALVAYVVLLLIDDAKGLGSALCRCRLESCRRFFLVKKPPTGRPRRDYCTTGHMLEAHALKSTERAQKSRAKKARKET